MLVIPAKAGIQALIHSWIPVFTGMTGKKHLSSYSPKTDEFIARTGTD
jgi:hypothetical protein